MAKKKRGNLRLAVKSVNEELQLRRLESKPPRPRTPLEQAISDKLIASVMDSMSQMPYEKQEELANGLTLWLENPNWTDLKITKTGRVMVVKRKTRRDPPYPD